MQVQRARAGGTVGAGTTSEEAPSMSPAPRPKGVQHTQGPLYPGMRPGPQPEQSHRTQPPRSTATAPTRPASPVPVPKLESLYRQGPARHAGDQPQATSPRPRGIPSHSNPGPGQSPLPIAREGRAPPAKPCLC